MLSLIDEVYALARSRRRLYDLLRMFSLHHNVRYAKGNAFIWAAENNHRNLVRQLLRLGPEVDTRGNLQHNGTSSHRAAAAGHLNMVEFLFRNGGYPGMCGLKGWKPLLLALLARHEEIVIFLFSKLSEPEGQIASVAVYKCAVERVVLQ